MRILSLSAAMAVLFSTLQAASAVEPRARFSGNNPTSVSGLVEQDGCFPAQFSGKVVRREFAKNGVVLNSITLEQPNGERTFVNVESDTLDKADAVTRADAIRAMQILLREGARVRVRVYACGAAGRVLMLEGVTPLR